VVSNKTRSIYIHEVSQEYKHLLSTGSIFNLVELGVEMQKSEDAIVPQQTVSYKELLPELKRKTVKDYDDEKFWSEEN